MENSIVVVSRQWKSPNIRAFVNANAVGAEMELASFLESLVEQMGNPTLLMTKTALLAKMQAASIVVLEEMKSTTSQAT